MLGSGAQRRAGGGTQRCVDVKQPGVDVRHAERGQARTVLVEVTLRVFAAVEQVLAARVAAGGVLAPQLPAQAGLGGDVGGEVATGLGQCRAPGAGKGEVDVQEGGRHRGLHRVEHGTKPRLMHMD